MTKPTTARGDDDFLGPPEQGFAKGFTKGTR
jgi:hypothetical protein